MYDGYLRYGGIEVANVERLHAYVDNGIVPTGVRFDLPDACDGLAEVLAGDAWEPYRSPIQDEPPWYDASNEDTYDFAGVLPLEVTGLDDSTRTVQMTPTVRDGALPGSARRAARTVGVTALLVGRTTEGVQSGLAWLRTALHGNCDAAEADCGPSATLEAFTVCPGPIYPTANLNLPPVVDTQVAPTEPGGDPNEWVVTGGTFNEARDDGTVLRPYDTTDTIEGGSATPLGDFIDAGPYTPAAPDEVDGGDANAATTSGTAILYGRPHGPTTAPVRVTWSLREVVAGQGVVVQQVLIGSDGLPFEFGPKHDLTTILSNYVWDLPFGVEVDGWRPGLIVDDVLVVASVAASAYVFATPLDCIAPYWRFMPGTVTTAGPTVVEEVVTDTAVLLKVEWVWVVGTPYRYGVTNAVLAGLSPTTDPPLVLPGVTWADEGVISAAPWNCEPPGAPLSCAVDPTAPGFGAPPAAPRITDTSIANITDQNVRSLWVCVGPEQVPVNDGVFNISLTAGDQPIVGARVRVWDDAQGDCTVLDPCLFAYEYLIDYVPADGIFTIDGVGGEFTTLCDGGNVLADASGVVRGDFGGPAKEPAARCDRRYLIRIQWLDTYPRSAPGVYTAGQPQGDLTVAVSVTNREG